MGGELEWHFSVDVTYFGGQVTHEVADLGRKVVALGIDRRDIRRLTIRRQENPELSCSIMASDIPFGPQHDAVTVHDPTERDFAVVRAKCAADLRRGRFIAPIVEAPDVVGIIVLS
jgi:hypothetical protein